MGIQEKLTILAAAAKYDVSCSSSGSNRDNKGGLGNAANCGICHSWSDDGRCISLLKILMSNVCIYDCAYCANRKSNSIARATFTPDEIVNLTMNFYRRNYIEGLFLSSGVIQSPDFTMAMLIATIKKLRVEENYQGYIHIKAIPGADYKLIREAGLYTDRMSVNIELPSENSLLYLAPEKSKISILGPMQEIDRRMLENKKERRNMKVKPLAFVPAGQSTQLVVGASSDSDYQIMRLSESLYQNFHLKRVYYSAYIPVNNDKRLPVIGKPPLVREHRLYQSDWLLRFYGFKSEEIVSEEFPHLSLDLDPKATWALRHLDCFPVEVNKADYEMLIRVPGIGIKSGQRIIKGRKWKKLNFEDLKKIGVVLKRAKYFLTCNGKMQERYNLREDLLIQNLMDKVPLALPKNNKNEMPDLFAYDPVL